MAAGETLDSSTIPEVVGACLFRMPQRDSDAWDRVLLECRGPHQTNAGMHGFIGGRVERDDGFTSDEARWQRAITRELEEELRFPPDTQKLLDLRDVGLFSLTAHETGQDPVNYRLFVGSFPPSLKIPRGYLHGLDGPRLSVHARSTIFKPHFRLTPIARTLLRRMLV